MHNNNAVTNMGGAIYAYNDANINIAANSAVYNNTAAGYGGGNLRECVQRQHRGEQRSV